MTIANENTLNPDARKQRCPECGSARFHRQVMLCQEGEVYDRPGDDEHFIPQKTVWEEVHEYAFCPDCRFSKKTPEHSKIRRDGESDSAY